MFSSEWITELHPIDRIPKVVTDKFQWVLSAAARVVINSRKYDRD